MARPTRQPLTGTVFSGSQQAPMCVSRSKLSPNALFSDGLLEVPKTTFIRSIIHLKYTKSPVVHPPGLADARSATSRPRARTGPECRGIERPRRALRLESLSAMRRHPRVSGIGDGPWTRGGHLRAGLAVTASVRRYRCADRHRWDMACGGRRHGFARLIGRPGRTWPRSAVATVPVRPCGSRRHARWR